MKLDNNLTRRVQDWLNTPESERDIRAGADMMLQLNRNRALHHSILMRPDRYKDKLVYELRKYLRIRLDNLTTAEVAKLEVKVMQRVQTTVTAPPVISSDDELPESKIARGRRADHDSLPDNIRDLWESNATRHRRIVLLFNELKAMSDAQPCDRYEKLRMLDDLESTYRANLAKYDAYVPEDSGLASDIQPAAPQPADVAKTIGAARKTISKYKKVIAANPSDTAKTDVAKAKIQAAVNVISAAAGNFSPETVNELSALGITF